MLFVSPGSPAKLCCSPHRSLLALLLMMVAALCSRGECPLRRERGARASCRGTVLSRQRAAAAHADTSLTRGRSSAQRVPQQRVLSSPSLVLSSPSPHPPHLRAMGPGEICAWAALRACCQHLLLRPKRCGTLIRLLQKTPETLKVPSGGGASQLSILKARG